MAQTSAALIPIFLYDLSNILIWVFFFFLHTNKQNKINCKILNSAATSEIWLLSQRAFIPGVFLQSCCVYVSIQLQVRVVCSG